MTRKARKMLRFADRLTRPQWKIVRSSPSEARDYASFRFRWIAALLCLVLNADDDRSLYYIEPLR